MNSFNAHGRIISKNYIEGSGVLKFTVAIKNSMKDKPDNKIPCVSFGKTAEVINKYCNIGHPFNIENGVLTSNEYEKDGRNFVSYEVVVPRVSFALAPPKNSTQSESAEMSQQIQEKKAEKPEGKLAQAKKDVKEEFGEVSDDDFDEEIPF